MEYSKELLDSLSIKDLMKDKLEIEKKEKENNNNKLIISDKIDEDINMEDNKEIDVEYSNIFEEIKEFISFDKNKNKSNNLEIKNKNNNYNLYEINCFIEPKNYINDYINNNKIKNIKTINDFPDSNNDLFDNCHPLLVKNPCDYFENNNNFIGNTKKAFIYNNIYKNQQFQGNNLFNFNKKKEENSLFLESEFQPIPPPYLLQKTIQELNYNKSKIFPYNISYYSPSFYPNVQENYKQYNCITQANNFNPLLKTIQNNGINFLNTFSSPSINEQIKHEGLFNYYSNNFNKNTLTQNTGQDKKHKKKLNKRIFIKNNKLVYVINEKHTDTKDVIHLDEDSESIKDGNNKQNKKLEIIKEKLAEERKPRSSKFRGVSKNGKHWQVLIMIKQKKRYIGNFSNEEEAAREYDKIAIQFHGPKAKTNFLYSEDEVKTILTAPKLEKLSNLI